jgi:hypothetical protein
MTKLKIPHADLKDFTLEDLQADLDKRLKESVGTVVAYGHETVQALISQIVTLREVVVNSVKELDVATTFEHMDQTSNKVGRSIVRTELCEIRNSLAESVGIKPKVDDTDW